jgi:hypothetical protein
MENFVEYVKGYVPSDWRYTSGGWIHGNCPMCIHNGEPRPDTKGRGGFNFDNNAISYNCFNCRYTARWEQGSNISNKLSNLLIEFGADKSDIQRFKLHLKMQTELIFSPKKVDETKWKSTVSTWKEISLPPKSKKLFDIENISQDSFEFNSINYIVGRNLDLFTDWYISDYYTYKNRIILPLRYNSKIVGHTSRLIVPSSKYPKYLKNVPKNYVFNIDAQKSSKKYVILTEGYFDAIFTDGVAIGSNYINDEQADIIESLNKEIIVLPDANEAGRRLALSAIERGWAVSYPPWEKGIIDVNDAVNKYGRLFTIYSILQNKITNTTKAKVKAKTWCS